MMTSFLRPQLWASSCRRTRILIFSSNESLARSFRALSSSWNKSLRLTTLSPIRILGSSSIALSHRPYCNLLRYLLTSHKLQVWVIPDVGNRAAEVREAREAMPLSQEVVSRRGKEATGIHRLSPFAPPNLRHGLGSGKQAKIPSRAETGQEVHPLRQRVQALWWFSIWIQSSVQPIIRIGHSKTPGQTNALLLQPPPAAVGRRSPPVGGAELCEPGGSPLPAWP